MRQDVRRLLDSVHEVSASRVVEHVLGGLIVWVVLGSGALLYLWTVLPQWLESMLRGSSPFLVLQVASVPISVDLSFTPANILLSVVVAGIVALVVSRKASARNIATVRKVVYYDPEYPTSFVQQPEAVRDFFVVHGFRSLNASQLKRWMQDRIRNRDAAFSLVVLAQDMVPDTVAEVPNETCTARRYMDAGGRIAWQGDVPFFYQGRSGKRRQTWGVTGCIGVLGVHPYPQTMWHGPPFPQLTQLTEDGKKWGHSGLDRLDRPVESVDVTTIFTKDPQRGCACSWHKNFNLEYPHSGFVRFWPGERHAPASDADMDFIRLATAYSPFVTSPK